MKYFTFYNTTNANLIIISASDVLEAEIYLNEEVVHPKLWKCSDEEGETLEEFMDYKS